jgi:hypothetical protein
MTVCPMNCSETQDLLLQAASIRDVPASVADHVRDCPECGQLVRDVERLEQQWRELPLPATVDAGREAFLRQLAQPAVRKAAGRFTPPRWAVAAVVLLAVGAAGWFVLPPSEARASDEVIERLIDWNLDLAGASVADRARLGERAATFHDDLGHVRAVDRDLAESLLQNGTWLAAHDDPLGVAERFDTVADQLLDRIQKATDAGERKRSDRLSRQYRHVLERGIDPSVRRVLASPALDFEHQRRVERVLLSDEGRLDKLAALLERAPDASRKEIRKALDLSKKQPKPAKRERPAGKRPISEVSALTPEPDGR